LVSRVRLGRWRRRGTSHRVRRLRLNCHKEVFRWTGEQPIDDAFVQRSRPPEFCRQNDLSLRRNYCLHRSKVASYNAVSRAVSRRDSGQPGYRFAHEHALTHGHPQR
jgi:hypothetical protein